MPFHPDHHIFDEDTKQEEPTKSISPTGWIPDSSKINYVLIIFLAPFIGVAGWILYKLKVMVFFVAVMVAVGLTISVLVAVLHTIWFVVIRRRFSCRSDFREAYINTSCHPCPWIIGFLTSYAILFRIYQGYWMWQYCG